MSPRARFLHDVTEIRILNEDIYASMARQKTSIRYCLTPFCVRIVSLFPLVMYICGMLRLKFLYPISERSLASPRASYSHAVTETRILNGDIYASMARQKLTRGYCLTHFCVRIVSLFPSSYVHLRRFVVNFFTPISEQVSGVPACSLLT